MFVCIEKNSDGSHAFQTGGNLEDGWAVIPDGMEIPDTFPFVNFEVAEVTHPVVMDGEKVLIPEYTQLEVISMTEGEEIPVEEPVVPTPEESVWAELDAAYREGVDSV